MTRPKKEKELARSRHINLRLANTQYAFLSEAAQQADLSLSEYIRRQLWNGKKCGLWGSTTVSYVPIR